MNAPRAALLGLVLLALPTTATAQEYSRFTVSFAGLNTQPLGALSTGPGWGLALAGGYALDPLRILHLRGELRGAIYDHESREVCFSATVGCRILLDLDTSYGILYVGVGPEVVIPIGPVRVALDATLGYTAFSATSTLEGIDDKNEEFASTTNYEDDTLAWSTGGALRIAVAPQTAIALGAHYQHNGTVSYLREGGIIDNPDGTLSFNPQRTEANLLALTLGVTFTPFATPLRR